MGLPDFREITGILAIDKPSGISSYDVIRKIKSTVRTKKIGHGGTLDVSASGVLPILFGEATKAFDFLLKGEKIYIATVRFGAFTETDDAEGEIIRTFDFEFDTAKLKDILPAFTGEIEQLPPKYSALRINGKRSYELARNNEEVILKPRIVCVKSITLDNTDIDNKTATLTITCSSGTYIRSIARDLGTKLGWGGYLEALRRTKSAGIGIDSALDFDSISPDTIKKSIIGLNESLSELPSLELSVDEEHIYNGKPLTDKVFDTAPLHNGEYRILKSGKLLAIISKDKNRYKYLRVFKGL
jgi:tRNA pseudouridine55 synthase